MNEIIVIHASDPDGRLFKNILDMLNNTTEKVSRICGNETELAFPGLVINIHSATVLRDGKQVRLNYGEFSTLCHLAYRPGYVFSKEQLYSAVYGENHYSIDTVSSTICRLRKKIEPDPRNPTYIKTVIGLGYKFEIPET